MFLPGFPDGQTILFECRDRQHAQICTTATDGNGPVKCLTTEDADHVLPTLSRNGRFVYYLSNRTGRQEAYRQGIGGGEPTQLSVGGAAGVMESWDGKSLYLESLKDGAGFLRIPVGHETVETAAPTESNRAYRVPPLNAVEGSPWTSAPGGMIFYLKTGHPDKLMLFDEATQSVRVFASIDPGEQPDLLSVASDGLSVIYSTLGKISGELDMLTTP